MQHESNQRKILQQNMYIDKADPNHILIISAILFFLSLFIYYRFKDIIPKKIIDPVIFALSDDKLKKKITFSVDFNLSQSYFSYYLLTIQFLHNSTRNIDPQTVSVTSVTKYFDSSHRIINVFDSNIKKKIKFNSPFIPIHCTDSLSVSYINTNVEMRVYKPVVEFVIVKCEIGTTESIQIAEKMNTILFIISIFFCSLWVFFIKGNSLLIRSKFTTILIILTIINHLPLNFIFNNQGLNQKTANFEGNNQSAYFKYNHSSSSENIIRNITNEKTQLYNHAKNYFPHVYFMILYCIRCVTFGFYFSFMRLKGLLFDLDEFKRSSNSRPLIIGIIASVYLIYKRIEIYFNMFSIPFDFDGTFENDDALSKIIPHALTAFAFLLNFADASDQMMKMEGETQTRFLYDNILAYFSIFMNCKFVLNKMKKKACFENPVEAEIIQIFWDILVFYEVFVSRPISVNSFEVFNEEEDYEDEENSYEAHEIIETNDAKSTLKLLPLDPSELKAVPIQPV
ncbi:hypothetical protein TRFO_18072 [Tritrichomonas foetus]|uniref:Uncharacterized protein n=1 Tax=Tritrichomonas foetus TaxID=1144522 RepID=A0A1J4KR34_9EUKA|nr:hypothetical protein TRFO_18072 [Tritrichomonas foetus]|eukprot:OHT12260.1 hypothetical protein TRFO_18072 [Tritrichomonas foetus]